MDPSTLPDSLQTSVRRRTGAREQDGSERAVLVRKPVLRRPDPENDVVAEPRLARRLRLWLRGRQLSGIVADVGEFQLEAAE